MRGKNYFIGFTNYFCGFGFVYDPNSAFAVKEFWVVELRLFWFKCWYAKDKKNKLK